MPSIEYHRLLKQTWLADVEHHATIGSTNDRAVELAKSANTRLPLLVIADRQTAGRGRGGNRWWTGEGSLAFSVLLDSAWTAANRRNTSMMGLAAGLAVLEAVRPLVGSQQVGLHWPNDVFAADRKLAGILVEVLPEGKAILGIGLNVNNSVESAPPELKSVATSLFDLTQNRHDRTSILISLLNQLERFLTLVQDSPENLAVAADAVCLQKNQLLHLQWGPTVYCGQCRGIDSTGAILLDTSEGLRAFPSGILLKR